jgi:hypothetical protein
LDQWHFINCKAHSPPLKVMTTKILLCLQTLAVMILIIITCGDSLIFRFLWQTAELDIIDCKYGWEDFIFVDAKLQYIIQLVHLSSFIYIRIKVVLPCVICHIMIVNRHCALSLFLYNTYNILHPASGNSGVIYGKLSTPIHMSSSRNP